MIYDSFAHFYDEFMCEVDYDIIVDFLLALWKKYDSKPSLVLDLGCGTGSVSVGLSEKGYDVIAVDSSTEMLSKAHEKARAHNRDILFLEQDMVSLDLYGTVDSIVSIMDCMNYILDERELFTVFSLCKNYLNKGGLFLFDINTEYKFKKVYGEGSFGADYGDCSYIWENHYDEQEKLNEYAISMFSLDEKSGQYDKTEENHYERAYSLSEIKRLLKKAGFTVLDIYDGFSMEKNRRNSERLFFAARA